LQPVIRLLNRFRGSVHLYTTLTCSARGPLGP
jgi:hypothetical protein